MHQIDIVLLIYYKCFTDAHSVTLTKHSIDFTTFIHKIQSEIYKNFIKSLYILSIYQSKLPGYSYPWYAYPQYAFTLCIPALYIVILYPELQAGG